MRRRNTRRRILAIDPTHRGFGYVVLEGPDRLVDWGLAQVRSGDAATITRVRTLVRRLEPDLVVVEDTRHAGCRRGQRVRRLLEGVGGVAATSNIEICRVSAAAAREPYARLGIRNKDVVAGHLVIQFPELGSLLPPRRRTWMSENENTAVFDALRFALAVVNSRTRRLAPGRNR